MKVRGRARPKRLSPPCERLYLEYSIEHESRINKDAAKLYDPALKIRDGRVEIPSDPDWGVNIKED